MIQPGVSGVLTQWPQAHDQQLAHFKQRVRCSEFYGLDSAAANALSTRVKVNTAKIRLTDPE
jgi:hypothetical protein